MQSSMVVSASDAPVLSVGEMVENALDKQDLAPLVRDSRPTIIFIHLECSLILVSPARH